MKTTTRLGLLSCGVLVVLSTCSSSQKPFDQLSATEHRAAAAREHQLANQAFAKITGENIVAPETLPMSGDTGGYREWFGGFAYAPYANEIDDPDNYVAWPRVTDPSEKYEDAASEHRENALRHEQAAAALEGRPSPRPLPPPHEPLLPPEQT